MNNKSLDIHNILSVNPMYYKEKELKSISDAIDCTTEDINMVVKILIPLVYHILIFTIFIYIFKDTRNNGKTMKI